MQCIFCLSFFVWFILHLFLNLIIEFIEIILYILAKSFHRVFYYIFKLPFADMSILIHYVEVSIKLLEEGRKD